jgi:hypothetical protein
MPLPRAVPVTLTAAERTILKKRPRGATTAHRDRLRAQIVLAAARGRDNARRPACSSWCPATTWPVSLTNGCAAGRSRAEPESTATRSR